MGLTGIPESLLLARRPVHSKLTLHLSAQSVAASFGDLLYSPIKAVAERNPSGNGARNRSFPEELFKSARKQNALSVSARVSLDGVGAYGSDAQKNKWLPLLQQGKAIGCFGLTEPQFGSNPGGMLTRAVKKGNKYILNGEKMWITSGSIADVAVVWAKAEDGKVRGFLVEKGARGFKTWDVHGKWSLRASVTSGLSFTDCEIPEENLLPGVVGLKGPLGCLNQARYGIGWGALGAAMACYDTALQYAKTRKQFANKPIASHQLVQEKLAWMITEIVKGQLLALHVGRLKDNGKVDPSHISMLKMNNVAIALETARKARDILGANGIVDDYCIMRHMNNLESVFTYEGTNDIHKLVIGERITGIGLSPSFSIQPSSDVLNLVC